MKYFLIILLFLNSTIFGSDLDQHLNETQQVRPCVVHRPLEGFDRAVLNAAGAAIAGYYLLQQAPDNVWVQNFLKIMVMKHSLEAANGLCDYICKDFTGTHRRIENTIGFDSFFLQAGISMGVLGYCCFSGLFNPGACGALMGTQLLSFGSYFF